MNVGEGLREDVFIETGHGDFQWRCPHCKRANYRSKQKCICTKPKPKWKQVSFLNKRNATEKEMEIAAAKKKPIKDKDWFCTTCQQFNFGDRATCFAYNCKGKRPVI